MAGGALVAGVPTKLRPAAWQVAQATPDTALCTIAGGALPLAFDIAKLVNTVGEWQAPQSAAVPPELVNGT